MEKEIDIKEFAKNMPQEEVDRLQEYYEGKRKLNLDELEYCRNGMSVINELYNLGRLKSKSVDTSVVYDWYWVSESFWKNAVIV